MNKKKMRGIGLDDCVEKAEKNTDIWFDVSIGHIETDDMGIISKYPNVTYPARISSSCFGGITEESLDTYEAEAHFHIGQAFDVIREELKRKKKYRKLESEKKNT